MYYYYYYCVDVGFGVFFWVGIIEFLKYFSFLKVSLEILVGFPGLATYLEFYLKLRLFFL